MEKIFIQEQVGDMVSNEWKIEHRYECNYILLLCLKLYNYQYGFFLRFGQMLYNMNFININYNEEPYDTIKNNLPKILNLLNTFDGNLSEQIIKNSIVHWLSYIGIKIIKEEEKYVLSNNNN